jgi:Tfp pilus assembly protein PilW
MRAAFSTKVRARGFTLVETVVGAVVGAVAFAAVGSMMLFGSKSTALMGNYGDLSRYSRNALDQMSTDIRQANVVLSCTTNQLQIQAVDINTGATNTLTYTYNAAGQTLTRIYEGVTNTLLKGIVTNSMQFAMYQRNPVGGDVTTNYLTTNAAICKVVQVSWVCSRNVLGVGQTESVQSAKIVIRKE